MLTRLLLAIFVLFSQSALAERWLAVTENAPPLQYMLDGDIKGVSTQLVRDVLEEAELSATFDMYPWARAMDVAMKRPNTLLFSTIRNSERESQFHWIGKLGRFQLGFVGLKTNLSLEIRQIEDATQYVIGAMRDDYTHQFLLGNGFTADSLIVRSSLQELMDLLYKGRIDAFIIDRHLVCDLAQMYTFDCEQLHMVYNIEALSVDVYLAANKDSSSAEIKRLQKAFLAVKQRPEYRRGFAGQ